MRAEERDYKSIEKERKKKAPTRETVGYMCKHKHCTEKKGGCDVFMVTWR
jgi:hypothetical protein